MRTKGFLFFSLVAIFLWSCGKIIAPDYRGVENVHISDISLTSVKLNFTVKMYNPNKIKLVTKSGKINVKLDEIDFGDVRLDSGFVLPPEELSSFTATAETTFKGIFLGILPTLKNLMTKDEIPMHLKGHMVAKTYGGIPLRIPIYKTEKIKLSQR